MIYIVSCQEYQVPSSRLLHSRSSRYLRSFSDPIIAVNIITKMSLPLRPSLLPHCSSCTRRLTSSVFSEWRPSQQQVRGKKKLANTPSTITVRLLKDVPTFGRKGTTPIASLRSHTGLC